MTEPDPPPPPLPHVFVLLGPDGFVCGFGRTRDEAWSSWSSRTSAPGPAVVAGYELLGYRCVECRLTPVEAAP